MFPLSQEPHHKIPLLYHGVDLKNYYKENHLQQEGERWFLKKGRTFGCYERKKMDKEKRKKLIEVKK